MEVFSTVVNQLDSLIWSMALVGLCLGAGFYLSLRLGFPQVRLIADMLRLLFGDKKSEHGISSFQSFATTVGARVGMGNIASYIYWGTWLYFLDVDNYLYWGSFGLYRVCFRTGLQNPQFQRGIYGRPCLLY